MPVLDLREAVERATTAPELTLQQPDLAARLAIAEAEVKGLRELLAERDRLLAEVKTSRDEARHSRDYWRAKLLKERRPWWKRLLKGFEISPSSERKE